MVNVDFIRLKNDKQCQDCKYYSCVHVPSELINISESDSIIDMLIVGEAPGRTEEEQQRPFIGKSGQVIRPMINILAEHGYKIIISNAVNCRPPGNETPAKKEIRTCNFVLHHIVNKHKPKVIIALGSVAKDSLIYLFPKTETLKESMLTISGQYIDVLDRPFRDIGTKVIVAPHPAQYVRTRMNSIFEEIQMAFELALNYIAKSDTDKALLADISLHQIEANLIDQLQINQKLAEIKQIVYNASQRDISEMTSDTITLNLFTAIERYRQTLDPQIDLRGYDLTRVVPFYTEDRKDKIALFFRKNTDLQIRFIDGLIPVLISKEELQKPMKDVAYTKHITELELKALTLNEYAKLNKLAKEVAFELGRAIKIPGLYAAYERPEQTIAEFVHAMSENMNSDMRILYLDIEVMHDDEEFPNPNQANYPIVVVTTYDNKTQQFTIHALKTKQNVTVQLILSELKGLTQLLERYGDRLNPDNINLVIYNNEKELVEGLLLQIVEDKPDIVAGWNVYFDICYIYNRAPKLRAFGRNTMDEIVQYLLTTYYGFPETTIVKTALYYPESLFEKEKVSPYANVYLHETIDLLDLYKWLTYGEKRSYSLDYTAKTLLNISGKLKHTGTISYLFENDPKHLFAYNLLDVLLTVLIDETQMFTVLANEIRHISGQTLLSEYSHLRVFPPTLYQYALKSGQAIVAMRTPSSQGSPPLTAAFVRQPVPGLYG